MWTFGKIKYGQNFIFERVILDVSNSLLMILHALKIHAKVEIQADTFMIKLSNATANKRFSRKRSSGVFFTNLGLCFGNYAYQGAKVSKDSPRK